eukprot:CAMPEP_0206506640 /NCGR_PEP_ID=MMETSP0324_2-20121206/56889_1 /ASSEMBLY_ACC=CAM_ASM_000836 /TAXON_ID=2866 /ORGANISM="Crypthecodinium cohnii, Strain Seligo" /LENGTH=63 /DNA_ID=CAMNT_0053996415 /DNA_START=1 /DNA_END=192 /DNA_ORIENTATION=-
MAEGAQLPISAATTASEEFARCAPVQIVQLRTHAHQRMHWARICAPAHPTSQWQCIYPAIQAT